MVTLKSFQIIEFPAHPPMYLYLPKEMLHGMAAVFGVLFEQGSFDSKLEASLSEQFPGTRTRKE